MWAGLCTSRAGTVRSSTIYGVRDRGEIEHGRMWTGTVVAL